MFNKLATKAAWELLVKPLNF